MWQQFFAPGIALVAALQSCQTQKDLSFPLGNNALLDEYEFKSLDSILAFVNGRFCPICLFLEEVLAGSWHARSWPFSNSPDHTRIQSPRRARTESGHHSHLASVGVSLKYMRGTRNRQIVLFFQAN